MITESSGDAMTLRIVPRFHDGEFLFGQTFSFQGEIYSVASSLTAFVDRYGFTWHSIPEVRPTRDIWCIHAMTLTYLHTRPTEGFRQEIRQNQFGAYRIITYTTNPARDRVQLYFGQTSSDPSRFENIPTIVSGMQSRGASMPRIILNAGFFDLTRPIDKSFGWAYARGYGLHDPENVSGHIGTQGRAGYWWTIVYYRNESRIAPKFLNQGYTTLTLINESLDTGHVEFIISGVWRRPGDNDSHRERTMMGVKEDGTIIFLMADAVTRATGWQRSGWGAITEDYGRAILDDMGARYILNLDGGGSTQFWSTQFSDEGEMLSFNRSRNIGSVFKIW